MIAEEMETRLTALAGAGIAQALQRFFKTGPGQYGAGDRFLGVKVPQVRKVAAACRDAALDEIGRLLRSPWHECRLLALLLLVRALVKGDAPGRKAVYELYLGSTAFVNNWDLVDAFAGPIVGGYLAERSRKPLYRLARSASLWERRIAVLATSHFLRQNDFADTFGVARLLLADGEDLIHKAVGWMLREVGKRDQTAEEAFLTEHYRAMPRTTLRYAIERFPEPRRRLYLRGEV